MNRTDAKRLSNRSLLQSLLDAGPDDPLWLEFVSRFQPRLRLAILRTYQIEAARHPELDTGSIEETAEDLTQAVFVKLLESRRRALSRFRGKTEHSIYTYLAAIGVNLVRDHFRKLRTLKTPKASVSLSNLVATEDKSERLSYTQTIVCDAEGPERLVAAREFRRRVEAAIEETSRQSRTSARDRLVFRLFFLEGLTISEIAGIQAVRLSASGVEKCVRRIREVLKHHLSEGGEAGGISS
ncbi:MAG TPA: sigma-70 family RNA polymerase sigma factor [Vicinamibacteria bacterium]|nr:sigma-70 family RNA polymerase sigma factor [Vicinamibacteria bacterium]